MKIMKQKPMAVLACIGTMMIAFFSSCATDDNAVAINTAENPEANQLAKWHPYEFRNLLYLRYYHPDGKFTTYRIENGQFKNANLPDYTMQVENEGQWGGHACVGLRYASLRKSHWMESLAAFERATILALV